MNKINLYIVALTALLLTGCFGEEQDCISTDGVDGTSRVVLTFVTPKSNAVTRASIYDENGYEDGSDYENYIDIAGNDYKIYFFTYSANDTNGGTLITEFAPEEVNVTNSATYTSYTVTGDVPDVLMDVTSFRIVVLANWGSYPSVTVGTTTIDNLCEGDNTTYSATGKSTIGEGNYIPFYGVQEYRNVSMTAGSIINLSPSVSLLRAVAKVEVIYVDDTDEDDPYHIDLQNVSIVNYNATGYCAPQSVYVAADYDTGYTNWATDFVSTLHLWGGTNDTETKSLQMSKVQDRMIADGTVTQYDIWRAYIPEYSNAAADFSYISVNVGDVAFPIYFAEYTDGVADDSAYYDIKRNNIYRFYVSLSDFTLTVSVDTFPWVERLDNVEF